jgi:hypothetical protein
MEITCFYRAHLGNISKGIQNARENIFRVRSTGEIGTIYDWDLTEKNYEEIFRLHFK